MSVSANGPWLFSLNQTGSSLKNTGTSNCSTGESQFFLLCCFLAFARGFFNTVNCLRFPNDLLLLFWWFPTQNIRYKSTRGCQHRALFLAVKTDGSGFNFPIYYLQKIWELSIHVLNHCTNLQPNKEYILILSSVFFLVHTMSVHQFSIHAFSSWSDLSSTSMQLLFALEAV